MNILVLYIIDCKNVRRMNSYKISNVSHYLCIFKLYNNLKEYVFKVV